METADHTHARLYDLSTSNLSLPLKIVALIAMLHLAGCGSANYSGDPTKIRSSASLSASIGDRGIQSPSSVPTDTSTATTTDTGTSTDTDTNTDTGTNTATDTSIGDDTGSNTETATQTETQTNPPPPPVDPTPPTVNITSVQAGDIFGGNIRLIASASDLDGVSAVSFYLDDDLIATDTSSPYSITLDSTDYPPGSYELSAEAFDYLANKGVSSKLPIQILAESADVSINMPDNLFVDLPSHGKIPVTLHPGSTVNTGRSTTVAFGLPLPRNTVADLNMLKVVDSNGNELRSRFVELARWHNINSGVSQQTEFLRSVLVYVEYAFSNLSSQKIFVSYGSTRIRNLGPQPPATDSWVAITDSSVAPNEFPASAGLREPAVYATLPASWLGASLLRTRAMPLYSVQALQDFDLGAEQFSRTAVNDVSNSVLEENRIAYSTEFEPWLFDRTSTLFGVYIQTGSIRWLRRAHRSAQFYHSRLNERGYFDLKTDTNGNVAEDLKYSYGQALLLELMLLGDKRVEAQIANIAEPRSEFNPNYELSTRFWTERHFYYTLISALSAWENTGSQTHAARVVELIETAYQMIVQPASASWNSIGCLLHTTNAHEGFGGDDATCSPWMSALLTEGIWRYYLQSQDPKALEIIASLGDYVLTYGLYTPDPIQSPGTTVKPPSLLPAYLASDENQKTFPYLDNNHACDVSGMLARAVWAKKQFNKTSRPMIDATRELVASCRLDLEHFHRPDADINFGKSVWRLAPARKYSWVYGSTSDLGWLLKDADISD